MSVASEIEPVASGLCLWRVYDPAVKAELYSTAIVSGGDTYLVDPAPLASDALSKVSARGAVAGIIVTNENHQRASAKFAREFRAPIYSADSNPFARGLTAIHIEGAPPGEIAVYCNAGGGTMIIGDALINFEPYGFVLLPPKYCRDAKLMRRSLATLLQYPFDRMLFAHGTPILSGAWRRLEQLLKER